MYFQRRCHENEKKNRKKLKMQNFENEKKNMAWRYGENLALICLTGSEKNGFYGGTDGRRTPT